MLAQSGHELKRLIFPHSIHGSRFGGQPYDLSLMKAVWASFALSVVVIVAAALLLSLSLPTFEAAFVAAIAAFANIGPLYSPQWATAADWPTYAEFDSVAKLVTVATMILGRLEVVVLFAAVNIGYWRS
jgi:trk system potassium uptake protein TrkH